MNRRLSLVAALVAVSVLSLDSGIGRAQQSRQVDGSSSPVPAPSTTPPLEGTSQPAAAPQQSLPLSPQGKGSPPDAKAGTAPTRRVPEPWARPSATPASAPTGAAATQQSLPLAPQVKGSRPRANPGALPPPAITLPSGLQDLAAPPNLALPLKPGQVRILELRPLGLEEVETLTEVNNPTLKALASQVEQSQSALRAEIARWYPSINLNANNFPTYSAGEQSTPGFDFQGAPRPSTRNSIWRMQAAIEASWNLIDPTRTPSIAAARDQFEQAKNQYLIGLRDLRLQAAQLYFDLQSADEQVRIGQESVRASLISLRDAGARFRAGVATRLEVLEAETQLARDQQLLTSGLASQATARRALAAILNLPQNVTPTAKDPSRVIGTWLPSLQESIVAAYAFREELDQILLNISIANSTANASLGEAQPFLQIFNSFGFGRSYGYEGIPVNEPALEQEGWNVDNTIGLNLRWNLFDGGRARALYRQQKQVAEENRFRFAEQRDTIRQEVETSYFELEKNNRNISTTSREVISTRESLRLARLRFQAGVTTQREVVDTQRDLTQAEVRYASAIADYNKRLAELRRRTGLDQIALCPGPSLPPTKPVVEGATGLPVEPQILLPACGSQSVLTDVRIPSGS